MPLYFWNIMLLVYQSQTHLTVVVLLWNGWNGQYDIFGAYEVAHIFCWNIVEEEMFQTILKRIVFLESIGLAMAARNNFNTMFLADLYTDISNWVFWLWLVLCGDWASSWGILLMLLAKEVSSFMEKTTHWQLLSSLEVLSDYCSFITFASVSSYFDLQIRIALIKGCQFFSNALENTQKYGFLSDF